MPIASCSGSYLKLCYRTPLPDALVILKYVGVNISVCGGGVCGEASLLCQEQELMDKDFLTLSYNSETHGVGFSRGFVQFVLSLAMETKSAFYPFCCFLASYVSMFPKWFICMGALTLEYIFRGTQTKRKNF